MNGAASSFHSTEETAQRIADRCRQDDPEWRYVVGHTVPAEGCQPWWRVEVYDEDGRFLGCI